METFTSPARVLNVQKPHSDCASRTSIPDIRSHTSDGVQQESRIDVDYSPPKDTLPCPDSEGHLKMDQFTFKVYRPQGQPETEHETPSLVHSRHKKQHALGSGCSSTTYSPAEEDLNPTVLHNVFEDSIASNTMGSPSIPSPFFRKLQPVTPRALWKHRHPRLYLNLLFNVKDRISTSKICLMEDQLEAGSCLSRRRENDVSPRMEPMFTTGRKRRMLLLFILLINFLLSGALLWYLNSSRPWSIDGGLLLQHTIRNHT